MALYRSLLLGMVFSMGTFAIKSGVGIYYRSACTRNGKSTPLWIAGMMSIYFILFFLSTYISVQMDIMRYLDGFFSISRYGMTIHFFMATLLMGWAILILRSHHTCSGHSLGWVPLVIPCPVCMLVIFISQSFLSAFFPNAPYLWMMVAFSGFVLISLVSARIMKSVQHYAGASADRILSASMLIISAYFILSAIFMPHFSDIDEIYRLADYTGDAPETGFGAILVLTGVVVLSFTYGFIRNYSRIRRI